MAMLFIHRRLLPFLFEARLMSMTFMPMETLWHSRREIAVCRNLPGQIAQ
jgi:hypothetical protein